MRKYNVFMTNGQVIEVECNDWDYDEDVYKFYLTGRCIAIFNKKMVHYIMEQSEKDECWLNGAELKIILNALNDRLNALNDRLNTCKAMGLNSKYHDNAIRKIEIMIEDMKLQRNDD